MPHVNEWIIPGRLLYQRIYGDVTVDDLTKIKADTNKIVEEEGTAPVHSIVDLNGLGDYPKNLRVYNHLFDDPEAIRVKYGWYVIIAPSPLVRFIASVAIQLAGVQMRVFPDRAAGEAFLLGQDATLQLMLRV